MTTTPPVPAPQGGGQVGSSLPDPDPKGRIGWIVAGSLITGAVAGVALALSPFVPATESGVTGAVLLGFALGWTMLAVLSRRFSDQPQSWAAAPALFLGLSGVLLLVGGSRVLDVLRWMWPPAMVVLVVWIVARSRQQLKSRARRWLLYPVVAVMALTAVAGGYETVREALDQRDALMAGQLIDVGGHRLHLSCSGTGSPTVILEPGAGLTSAALGWVAPAVARDTRICIYDRAGRGWSEPATTSQDATQIASDLHTLLQQGRIAGPYVLAGHSFGGLYALTFAADFPRDVAGMVLVDSTAPAASAPSPVQPRDDHSDNIADRVAALLSATARLGVGRLIAQFDYDSLPPPFRDESRASAATVSHVRSTIDEYLQASASAQEAATLQDFGDKPLVVLTAGIGSDAAWHAAQDRLATLSTDSAHRVIDGAGHSEFLVEEPAAAATTQAILDVVTAVRHNAPLHQ